MNLEFDSLKSRLGVFGLIVVILSFAYMPALQGYFLYLDDYNLWTIKDVGSCEGWYASNFAKELGRPLLNPLICAYSQPIDSINDAKPVRFVGILLLALIIVLLSRVLRSNSSSAVNSLLAAFAIATLPPSQVTINGIILQVQIITILLAIAAYFLAMKGANCLIKYGKIFNIYSFISIAV